MVTNKYQKDADFIQIKADGIKFKIRNCLMIIKMTRKLVDTLNFFGLHFCALKKSKIVLLVI